MEGGREEGRGVDDDVHSHAGPNRESLMALTAVGTPQRRGFDIYRSTVTRTTGNHGDTYTCTASNGASTSTRNYTISGKNLWNVTDGFSSNQVGT